MEYATDGYLTDSPSARPEPVLQGRRCRSPTSSRSPRSTPATTTTITRATPARPPRSPRPRPTASASPSATTRRCRPTRSYNYTKKQTDFDYVRVNGDFGRRLHVGEHHLQLLLLNNTLSALNNGRTDPTARAPPHWPPTRPMVNLGAADWPIPPAAPATPSPAQVATACPATPSATSTASPATSSNSTRTPPGQADRGFGVRARLHPARALRHDLVRPWPRPRLPRKVGGLPEHLGSAGHCNYPVPPGKTNNGACQIPLNTALQRIFRLASVPAVRRVRLEADRAADHHARREVCELQAVYPRPGAERQRLAAAVLRARRPTPRPCRS